MYSHPDAEVLTTRDATRWQGVLDEIGSYSFYHLPAFHKLSEMRGEGEAVMPVFREAGHVLAFPMLVREIDGSVAGAVGLRDATSVCGFAGPIVSPRTIPEPTRQRFLARLQRFFRDNSIVTAYSRLHPLFDGASLLDGFGETREVGATLSIDLTQTPEAQFSRYRPTRRKEIRRLKRIGFHCRELGADRLDEFLQIYDSTMDRVGAETAFQVDRRYFEHLLSEAGCISHMLACMLDDDIASVAICFVCGGVMEAYRGGTPSEYLGLSPMNLLYDAFGVWGREAGATRLHLGGGVGAQRDSLYDYKLAFHPDEHPYYTWRHVVDKEAYEAICSRASAQAGTQQTNGYFPAYRDPALCSGTGRR